MSSGKARTHPIAVASARSGLSQDVLRVWERRYQVVRPERGPKGQRLYSEADIERLRLLRLAVQGGRNIASVAGLATDAVAELVSGDLAAGGDREPTTVEGARSMVDTAFEATRALDSTALDGVLRAALALGGVTAFVEGVAVPLLRRIGEEWHAGRLSPAAEHMASAVSESVLLDAMSRLRTGGGPRMVVTTLAGERHNLGALMVSVVAASLGWSVAYLGGDLPAEEIAWATTSARADVVAVSVVLVTNRREQLDELRQLRRALAARVEVFVGGAGAQALKRDLGEEGIRVFDDLPALRAALAELSQRT
jgi:MerR family transcriptional regulator, light-induced transcriptional regulator